MGSMRGDSGFEEVRLFVERAGYGANKWRWRLADDSGVTVSVGSGFNSAEDAYVAARRQALALRSARIERQIEKAARADALEKASIGSEITPHAKDLLHHQRRPPVKRFNVW